MLKALIKKQFLELKITFNPGRRRKKKNGKPSNPVAMAVIFTLSMLVVAVMLGFMGYGMTSAFAPLGLGWLTYAISGIIALVLGIVGSVFNTYSSLYKAKDNDLLLAMPIPPAMILFARMLCSYLMCLLFTSIVWIPAMIGYLLVAGATPVNVILPIVLDLFIALLAAVFTCFFGWIVALVAGKTKGKNYITSIISVVIFLLYMLLCTKFGDIFDAVFKYKDQISSALSTWVYPIYQLSMGAEGSIIAALIFIAIAVAAFAVCYFILSKTFISLTTKKPGVAKTKYDKKFIKTSSVKSALLKRELRHLISSNIYLLNCGIGVVFMPIIGTLALVYSTQLTTYVAAFRMMLPGIMNSLPALAAAFMCLISSMCVFTCPSVSLEGKSFWLIRSLPVSSKEILAAKIRMHVLLTAIPAAVSAVMIGIALKLGILDMIFIAVLVVLFVVFTAYLGLIFNLKKPMLDWTSEVVVVKQNVAVLVVMLLGWLLAVGIGALGIFAEKLSLGIYVLPVVIVIFCLLNLYLKKWTETKGVVLLENI